MFKHDVEIDVSIPELPHLRKVSRKIHIRVFSWNRLCLVVGVIALEKIVIIFSRKASRENHVQRFSLYGLRVIVAVIALDNTLYGMTLRSKLMETVLSDTVQAKGTVPIDFPPILELSPFVPVNPKL